MTKRARRTFSKEFKIEPVKLVTEAGYSFAEAAKSLDISESLLRRWNEQFTNQGNDGFPGNGNRTAIEQELHKLRDENKRLRAEREILRKAAAFFAKESL